jgi:hypothetical protein
LVLEDGRELTMGFSLRRVFAQLFEAQDVAQSATQAILVFIRKSIEGKYGVTGAPPAAEVKKVDAVDDDDQEMDAA